MNPLRKYCCLIIVSVILAGCEKNGPVELSEDGNIPSTDMSIENGANSLEPVDPSAQDSTSCYITTVQGADGQLTIAGSIYDDRQLHEEISIVRAMMINKSSPIIVNNETVGYHTFDLGTVTIDDIPLQSDAAHLPDPRLTPRDTIGPRYVLLNRDGVGGRGFQYTGRHAYRWLASGSPGAPSLDASITSPAALSILTPGPRDVVSAGRSLVVRWVGGGDAIKITLCGIGVSQRPLLQLNVKRNNGGVTIPRKLLQLLPRGQSRFLFTVTSESRETIHATGYDGAISVRAITTHTLVLNIRW